MAFTFYAPQFNTSSELVLLTDGEHHHLRNVLRMTEGMEVELINGKGLKGQGVVHRITKKESELFIQQIESIEKSSHDLQIVVSPPKTKERFQFMLEKLTELGVRSIGFMQTEHSERQHWKMDKAEQQLIAAAKQCGQAFLPNLLTYKNLREAINQTINYQNRWMAYTVKRAEDQLPYYDPAFHSSVVFIGPEGGFSPGEATLAQELGVQLAGLGKLRLRTETAAFKAACLLAG